MAKKIVTFGELLLRFSKLDHLRLTQGDMFTSKYGGSEANVAVSLATLGDNVEYITRLPDNAIGKTAMENLRQLGVDTHRIIYGGTRIGTYYLEPAAGMRASKVIYDRNGSAYYELKPGMIPWREILKDADILHVSGITASISQNAADATFEALDVADELGLQISFDINYRKNLWKYGADPRATLKKMLSRCDMMFGDAIEFEWICQRQQPPFTATTSDFEMQMDEYREWFDDLHAEFPRCKRWLMGMRNIVASSHHTLTALLWTHGQLLQAPIYNITDVIDPVGVGDAFMAGLLHSLDAFPDDEQMKLNYALAAAAVKNTIPGDFNLASDDEIKAIIK
ncbi:sugar kinase [Prevotella sp. E9-3]|uniref:sugar kinase n=1 Tax=Prevotella sp. E9-3 TaxID=2913621 RepID=UPI001EDAA22E|nr:sugar kinase [Prevotella sp. E9-3]UKK49499.1 sugar kinase [Prevotella sp. E9-3]